ncbi:MAG: peptide chain release factor N(5)-glutamine methyltransferase [Actinobacteria bacterium]|nr:peptide chain release factor N(5)-glutamine methyltransferase [Actinomycetota bacterium]
MDAEELLAQAKKTLKSSNERFGFKGEEEDQAWELLVHALGGEEPEYEDEIPAGVKRRFDRFIARRATGEPIAYIVGEVEFRDLQLGIKPGMFIPRYTSEFLAHQAIRRLHGRKRPVHVDLATGIGPVALSSAQAVPAAQVWGLDISQKALNQATANAASLGLRNVRFKRSDLFSALSPGLRGKADVVTIHPPYVPRKEVADLPDEIKKFEPGHTLSDGSHDGLGLVRRVVAEGRDWIRPGGWLLIEIVPSEFRTIRPLLRDAGYRDIRSTHGQLRHTRVITGRV